MIYGSWAPSTYPQIELFAGTIGGPQLTSNYDIMVSAGTNGGSGPTFTFNSISRNSVAQNKLDINWSVTGYVMGSPTTYTVWVDRSSSAGMDTPTVQCELDIPVPGAGGTYSSILYGCGLMVAYSGEYFVKIQGFNGVTPLGTPTVVKWLTVHNNFQERIFEWATVNLGSTSQAVPGPISYPSNVTCALGTIVTGSPYADSYAAGACTSLSTGGTLGLGSFQLTTATGGVNLTETVGILDYSSYMAQKPSISSINGGAGVPATPATNFTISGANFDTVSPNTKVYFGGYQLTCTVSTSTNMTCTSPPAGTLQTGRTYDMIVSTYSDVLASTPSMASY
jgi:hypothetical protein